ncbi:MAG: hypothetical protein SVQ76_00675 [Candidatus Nanohaloarchaea archaeon]|nr:hypothetical protein [Candidatus Nanohaloarchaea archaeon]
MKPLLLVAESVSAVFAVLFIGYYMRILAKAQEIGPEPVSWIITAVGLALIASFGVLQAFLIVKPVEVLFHVQRVYFMLGNMILLAVFYRMWRRVGGKDGW